MAFSGCIKEAAKFLNKKIPGKRNETWTKHFESGVIVSTPLNTGINVNDLQRYPVHCSSDGTPGGKTRVMRYFPVVNEWKGTITVTVLDDMIDKEIFSEVIVTAGSLIGIGTFRPRNRGYFGRFEITNIKWE
jgi:hypothetical protein